MDELTVIGASTEIAEYASVSTALASLDLTYKGAIYDCTTAIGMDAARGAEKELQGYVSSLEKSRKDKKAYHLEAGRRIDSQAREIDGRLCALLEPIKEQILTVTRAKARAEEAARVEAERLRVVAEAKLAADQAEVARQLEAISAEKSRIENEARLLAESQRVERQRIEDAAKMAEQHKANMEINAKLDAERLERLRLDEVERVRLAAERVEKNRIEDAERVARQITDDFDRAIRQQSEDESRAELMEQAQIQMNVCDLPSCEVVTAYASEINSISDRDGHDPEVITKGSELLAHFVSRYAHVPVFSEIADDISAFLHAKIEAAR